MRRLIRAVLMAVAAATTGAVASAPPAAAVDVPCHTWSTEQDMVNDSGAWCRSTWMVEPGVGNLLTRDQLLAHADLYAPYGFTRQWIEYAHETTIVVPAGSAQEWSSCPPSHTYSGSCPVGTPLNYHRILSNFSPGVSVRFHVFEYGGAFVMRACGNFWYPVRLTENPVPWVTVHKFDDRDRSGGQDAGEGPLGGWTFQIHRRRSRSVRRGCRAPRSGRRRGHRCGRRRVPSPTGAR